MIAWINNLDLLPIFLPLLGAVLALPLRKNYRLQGKWALGVMLFSLISSAILAWQVTSNSEALVIHLGGWQAPFGITLVADSLAVIFVLMTQISATMGVIYAMGSQDAVTRYPTFYPLLLALCAGLTGTLLTGDLFNLFVFAELLLISGTVLAAISDHRSGVEAALKYFYMSLLASTFMLLAIGCFYVSYGTLNMADLAARVAQEGERLLLIPGIILLMIAFLIKSAVFPFHFWQPDLYMTAPTPVAAVLAAVVSKLGVYGLLRMGTLLFPEQASKMGIVLIVLSVAAVIYGGLGAIGTQDIKRMLAYSSMAQMGFIILAIGWGTGLALTAAIVYAFNHSLIKGALLMLSGKVVSHSQSKSSAFKHLRGLGKSTPVTGILFFTGALALAGIPPLNGFISKALLFSSGIAAQGFWPLLLIGLASIFTMIYTIRAFQQVWWAQPEVDIQAVALGDKMVAPLILVAMIVILGLWAEPLVNLAQNASQWMLDPNAYILAVLGGG